MKAGKKGRRKRLFYCFIVATFIFVFPVSVMAVVTGVCSNCHTMHNSENNAPMDDFASTLPWASSGGNASLLRGTCLGCHGMGGSSKIAVLGTGAGQSRVPQVFHNDLSGDLAGGNFAYITGDKGSGSSNQKGHNVIDLGPAYEEDSLFNPPGAHHLSQVTATEFTCAGKNGCHGTRDQTKPSGIPAVAGAHHRNVNGRLATPPTAVYDSYRFLKGVMGYENNTGTINDWQNVNNTSHNEYFGSSTPMSLSGCASAQCHPSSNTNVVEPASGTISAFCGTCHGAFHSVEGIGGDNVSPFTRHPTDVVIPDSGEFTGFTTWNAQAPVGRQSVPTGPVSTISRGSGGDVVICLSCHVAHASDYPDMLKWDYNTIAVTNGHVTNPGETCFVCHTAK